MASILDVFKKGTVMNPGSEEEAQAKKLHKYLLNIESKVRSDWHARVNGDGTYVGYRTLRDFYKGKQWIY